MSQFPNMQSSHAEKNPPIPQANVLWGMGLPLNVAIPPSAPPSTPPMSAHLTGLNGIDASLFGGI